MWKYDQNGIAHADVIEQGLLQVTLLVLAGVIVNGSQKCHSFILYNLPCNLLVEIYHSNAHDI